MSHTKPRYQAHHHTCRRWRPGLCLSRQLEQRQGQPLHRVGPAARKYEEARLLRCPHFSGCRKTAGCQRRDRHNVVPGKSAYLSVAALWRPGTDMPYPGWAGFASTKWGSCNHRAGHIRLNTELVKKPKDLLEYEIVHEMAHLLEPTHSDRFVAILDKAYPTWREARAELNDLPLAAEVWEHK